MRSLGRAVVVALVAACGSEPPEGVPPPGRSGPLPVVGGTLAVLPDGGVVAADPEADRLVVAEVDAGGLRVARDVGLSWGARPGRLAVEADGTVWAVLRGAAAVARLGPDGAVRVLPACPDPRGIDVGPDGVAWVACAGGELVALRPDGEIEARLSVAPDLRDVLVVDGLLWVSRFRAAEVLVVDRDGVVLDRRGPPVTTGAHPASAFEPAVAWRLVRDAEGEGALLAHQRARPDPISLDDAAAFGAPAYGGAACDAVVQAGLTWLPFDGGSARTLGPLLKSVLPVDVVARPGGEALLVAAGATGLSDVAVGVVRADAWGRTEDCTMLPGLSWSGLTPELAGRAVAAADTPAGVVVQLQAPFDLVLAPDGGAVARLGAEDEADRGVEVFHAAPTGSVACASCHPEGGDDGRTWRFVREGREQARRTQSLAGGAALATAPLHWDGEHADLAGLLQDTLARRIGAPVEAGDVEALEALLARVPPAPRGAADPAQAARGEEVFEASGCATCHGGAWRTDGLAHDVGTLEPDGAAVALHTPSLVGLAARGPWMHDGCARTLAERFEPGCGGAAHGTTPSDPDALAALLAFLGSL